MKTMLCRTITVVALMLCFSSARAEVLSANRDGDHGALRALMARVTQAVNEQDIAGLQACFTKRFVFTTVDQSVLTNTLTLKNYYDRMLHSNDSPVSAYRVTPKADARTVFVDSNTGYCYGTSDDVYTLRRNGRKVHMPCHWTATVVKEDGEWKVAALHAGVNVLDNTVLRVRTLPWWRKGLLAIGIGKYPGEVTTH